MSFSLSFAGCQQKKEFGMEKIKKRRYGEALLDFQKVVDNLFADNDKKAALKMSCYNQMALCYLELEEFDNATIAFGEAITIFDKMRPNELEKKQHRKNDILFPHFHTSFVRRGQIFEKQGNFPQALSYYNKAKCLTTKGEANQRIQDVLVQFGIPPIDMEDEKLEPFSRISNFLFEPTELISCFKECVQVLSHNPPTKDAILYMDSHGITQLILGMLNFNITSEINVDIALTIINYFARLDANKFWANSDVLIKVLKEYHDNNTIVSDILTLLSHIPKDKYVKFASKEVFDLLLETFNLELKESEFHDIFLLLFYILSNVPENQKNETISYLNDTNILDLILSKKSKNGLILLSRLAIDDYFIEKIKCNGSIEWISEYLNANLQENVAVDVCSIIFGQCLSHPTESDHFKIEDFAANCFSSVMPAVMANTKNFENLNELLSLLTRCIKHAPQAVGPSKVILVTAAALAVNMSNAKLILTSLDLIYECAVRGLKKEVTESKIAVSTAMKTLEKFHKNQPVVEKTIGIAIEMEHPGMDEILHAAIVQFPSSLFLKKYSHLLVKYVPELNHK